MKKLNYKQVNELINYIKTQGKLKINVFRAVREFLLKRKNEIYEYENLYFISEKWVYNPNNPQHIEPLPGKSSAFCGWLDSNDDTYHYWLKDKKTLSKYGITYNDYKEFNSINWFIDSNNNLYIDGEYYKKIPA